MVFSNGYLLLSLSSLNSRLSDHQKSDFCISIKIIITWPLHEIWGTIIVWWAINTIEGRKDYYESNSNSAFAKCRSGPWWCYSAVCISTNNSFKSTNWLILYINNLYLFAVHCSTLEKWHTFTILLIFSST